MFVAKLDDYKYTVEFGKKSGVKKDIHWDDLIDAIAKHNVSGVEAVRFHHPGSPHGQDHIGGFEMLALWKAVEKNRKLGSVALP
jgi:D-serine deaminase-like pyridoxal phosphate-dependent protein